MSNTLELVILDAIEAHRGKTGADLAKAIATELEYAVIGLSDNLEDELIEDFDFNTSVSALDVPRVLH